MSGLEDLDKVLMGLRTHQGSSALSLCKHVNFSTTMNHEAKIKRIEDLLEHAVALGAAKAFTDFQTEPARTLYRAITGSRR